MLALEMGTETGGEERTATYAAGALGPLHGVGGEAELGYFGGGQVERWGFGEVVPGCYCFVGGLVGVGCTRQLPPARSGEREFGRRMQGGCLTYPCTGSSPRMRS